MTRGEGLSHWQAEPVRVWQELWGIPLLEVYATLTSTNDRARELARGGALPFTTVIAEEQSAGRGRGGRSWASPAGQGLWLSTLVGGAGREPSPLTPILAGVAVARAVAAVAPACSPGIKWPNDVMLDGRKVCGILCEAGGDGSGIAVGIGINVRQRPADFPPHLRGSAISLENAHGGSVSRQRLAGALMQALRELLAEPRWRLDAPLAEEVWALDVLRGRMVTVSTGPGGRCLGVAEDGTLRVEDEGGRERAVSAGTVGLRAEDATQDTTPLST